MGLATLPDETITLVFAHLPVADLYRVSRVCRHFKELVAALNVRWSDDDCEGGLATLGSFIFTFPRASKIELRLGGMDNLTPAIAEQLVARVLRLGHLESVLLELSHLNSAAVQRLTTTTHPRVKHLDFSWDLADTTEDFEDQDYEVLYTFLGSTFPNTESFSGDTFQVTDDVVSRVRRIFPRADRLELGIFVDPAAIMELCTTWGNLRKLYFGNSEPDPDVFPSWVAQAQLSDLLGALSRLEALTIPCYGVLDGQSHFARSPELRHLNIVGEFTIRNVAACLRLCPKLQTLCVPSKGVFQNGELEALPPQLRRRIFVMG